MRTRQSHITILGAGLAGLSAGWRLSRAGHRVRIIEAGSQVGGMARTLHRDGYRFDLGPHRFYTENREVLRLLMELLEDELIVHRRLSRVRLNGRYLDYPPNLPDLIRGLQPTTALRCILDYLSATSRRVLSPSAELDFQSWVINRFGQQVYEINFGPYTQKVWGILPSQLSAELARRRVSTPNLADVMVRLLFPRKGAESPYITRFWYPEAGIGRIAERLADGIAARQGEILLEHSVESVHLDGGQVTGLTVNHHGIRKQIPCELVLSTIPLPYLIRCLDPTPVGQIQNAAALPYRALLFIFLYLDRPRVSQEHWLYFPEQHFSFNRISEPKNFSPGHAPPGKTSLCAEITCDEGDETWRMEPHSLVERVVQDLVSAGLIQAAEVEGFFIRRSLWGYPIYTVGYEHPLQRVLDYIEGMDNLFTFGRQGAFDYSNMAESIACGLKTAEMVKRKVEVPSSLVISRPPALKKCRTANP